MKYSEEEIIKAISLLESFTTDHNAVIIKAKTLLERSFFHSPHFEIKNRYRNDVYFILSSSAIKARKYSQLQTHTDLVNFLTL